VRTYTLALSAVLATAGCTNEDPNNHQSTDVPFKPIETCLVNTAGLDVVDTTIRPAPSQPTIGIVEPIVCVLDPDRWGFSESGGVVTTTRELARINVPLLVEPGEELVGVEMWWLGAGGHAALPSGLPAVSVWRTDMTGTSTESIGYALDVSPDHGIYQSAHTVSAFVVPEVVDVERYKYHAVVYSEYGDDAIPGAVFLGMRRLILDE
jgi:hypothetical protein